MVLMQVRHGWMGIDFIWQNIVFLKAEENSKKGLYQTTLNDGCLPNPKVL